MSLYRRIALGVLALFTVTVLLGVLLQGGMMASYHSLSRIDETVETLTLVREYLREVYSRTPDAAASRRINLLSERVGHTMLRLEEMDILKEQLAMRLFAANTAVPLAVMLVSLAVILTFIRNLTRPLTQLTGAMKRHTAGDAAAFPLPMAGVPEVRLLTEAANSMIETIGGQQEALARQARVLGWRNAAREVVHEMKNILTPARLAAETLVERAAGEGDLHRQGLRVLESLSSMERLAAALGDVGAMRIPQPVPRDLHALAGAAVNRFAGGPLVLGLEGEMVIVSVDGDLVASALDNLIINAREAGAETVVLSAGSYPDGCGFIACSDDGSGVPPEQGERIFRVNVTTKRGGTGFGLYLVKKIAEEHGGRVELGPGIGGRGASVRMVFNGNNTDRR